MLKFPKTFLCDICLAEAFFPPKDCRGQEVRCEVEACHLHLSMRPRVDVPNSLPCDMPKRSFPVCLADRASLCLVRTEIPRICRLEKTGGRRGWISGMSPYAAAGHISPFSPHFSRMRDVVRWREVADTTSEVWDKNRTKKVSTALQIWGRWARGVVPVCQRTTTTTAPPEHIKLEKPCSTLRPTMVRRSGSPSLCSWRNCRCKSPLATLEG